MPTLDITDGHRDRIETLCAELAAAHAGAYASVGTDDALRYLLDLAEAVDDPERTADPEVFGASRDGSTPEPTARESLGTGDRRDHGGTPFDTKHARERLESRNRKHSDPDDADEMDLYAISAAFDVTGRSEMTKAELVDAILDAAARLAADPFVGVDLDLDSADEWGDPAEPTSDAEGDPDEAGGGGDGAGAETNTHTEPTNTANTEYVAAGDEAEADGASQLDAMMSLLDTHDDKWREGDGDVRYEVDLPDGSVETARTKDDVRALLFRNY